MKQSAEVLILLIIIILSSCGRNNQNLTSKTDQREGQPHFDSCGLQQNVDISININEAKTLANFNLQKYNISFDESVENIIGFATNIVVKNDTIFAVDGYKSPGVYAYSKEGKQLFAYCSIGNGPEDILNPRDLSVTDSEISIFDRGSGNIVVFDKRGSFKRKIKTDIMAVGGIMDDNKCIWIDYSNQRSSDGAAKISYRPDSIVNFVPVILVPEHLKGFTTISLQPFHRLPDGQIIYLAELEPTVYNLSNGKASVRYNLDFNGLWPSKEEMNKIKGSYWAIKLRDMPMQRLGIQECDKWLIVHFYYDKILYIHVYDKYHNTGFTIKDTDGVYTIPQAVTDEELYLKCNDDSYDVVKLQIN